MTTFFALHGFTGTPASFDVLKLDSLQCPVLGGHGAVPCVSRKNFEEEVAHLVDVARRLNAPGLHLLGYSMGARLALALLLAAPELFAQATLLGVNPGLEGNEAREERATWESDWIQVLEHEGLFAFEAAWSSQPLFASQKGVSPRVQQTQREARLSHTSQGLAHAMKSLGLSNMPNLWEKIEEVTVPTRLIVGLKDAKFRDIALRMKAENSIFQLSELPGVGHNPLLECPGEVRRLVLERSQQSLDDSERVVGDPSRRKAR